MAMAALICLLCADICFSCPASAQSHAVSPPRDVISGYVLDEYGRPVPDATVTLRHDSQLWQPGPLAYPDSRNPQSSGNRSDNAGTYLFGVLSPGQYVVTAEKYGRSGSANVTISNDVRLYPLKVNVTIADFDFLLSRDQLNLTGAIAGNVTSLSGRPLSNVAVFLMQNRQPVNISGNPRHAAGNYTFRHLAPGQYELCIDREPGFFQSVNVSNDTVIVDFVVPTPELPDMPTPVPSPTQTPGQGIIVALLSIGLAATLLCNKIRR